MGYNVIGVYRWINFSLKEAFNIFKISVLVKNLCALK